MNLLNSQRKCTVAHGLVLSLSLSLSCIDRENIHYYIIIILGVHLFLTDWILLISINDKTKREEEEDER